MGTALGGLAYKQRLDVIRGSNIVRIYKRDIGLGGGAVAGYRRSIDIWIGPARELGFISAGVAVVRVSRNRCY